MLDLGIPYRQRFVAIKDAGLRPAYLIATLCGYKGCLFSAYLMPATVCGYKGCRITVFHWLCIWPWNFRATRQIFRLHIYMVLCIDLLKTKNFEFVFHSSNFETNFCISSVVNKNFFMSMSTYHLERTIVVPSLFCRLLSLHHTLDTSSPLLPRPLDNIHSQVDMVLVNTPWLSWMCARKYYKSTFFQVTTLLHHDCIGLVVRTTLQH